MQTYPVASPLEEEVKISGNNFSTFWLIIKGKEDNGGNNFLKKGQKMEDSERLERRIGTRHRGSGRH